MEESSNYNGSPLSLGKTTLSPDSPGGVVWANLFLPPVHDADEIIPFYHFGVSVITIVSTIY